MITFEYTIHDPLGIHARPAGMLAKLAKEYADNTISLEKDGQTVRAGQMMRLMSLAIKQGDLVKVTVSGNAEEEAAEAVRAFFEQNL